MAISPHLSGCMLAYGCELPFALASELLNKTTSADIGKSQIHELLNRMGKVLRVQDEEQEDTVLSSEKIKAVSNNLSDDSVVYGMIDGAMLHFRGSSCAKNSATEKSHWGEVKLLRIFTENSYCKDISKKRGVIMDSIYAATFSRKEVFEAKIQPLLDPLESLGNRLVFINDGAPWIWDIIHTYYPNSTQVLDFYHLSQHVYEYLKLVVKDEKILSQYFKKLNKMLLESKSEEVKKYLRQLNTETKEVKKALNNLLAYMEKHKKRIDYKAYSEKGLRIGSGPIESAHRNVLQTRMKRAGQYWGKETGENFLQVKTREKSGLGKEVNALFLEKNFTLPKVRQAA